MKKTNKKLIAVFASVILLAFSLTSTVFAADTDSIGKDIDDAVSTANDAVEDIVTDVSEAIDPDDGDVGRDTSSNGTVGDTTNEMPADDNNNDNNTNGTTENNGINDNNKNNGNDNGAVTTDTNAADNNGNDNDGINPWAVVIAVIAVIAILILIFVLIPKRR